MIGDRYGRLTVLGIATNAPSGHHRVLCSCTCGVVKAMRKDWLTRLVNPVVSCGCHRRALRLRHGRARRDIELTPEYTIWVGMRERCRNRSRARAASYVGKGIAVCERWGDFEAFLADMGPRPSPAHSIERLDNGGDYTPGNCIWATAVAQARNKSTNHRLTVDGVSMTIAEWSEATGILANTIVCRIRYGWTAKDAVTLPVRYGYKYADLPKEAKPA